MLVPLQAGSWLISIFAIFGAAPVKLTTPLTLAAVAGSMGVAAGAAASPLGVAAGSSLLSFFEHAGRAIRPRRIASPSRAASGLGIVISTAPLLELEQQS